MKPEIEPLPPDVAQLLSRGAAMVEPPAHVRMRLRERVAATVASPVSIAGPATSRWTRFQGVAAAAAGSRAFIGLAGFLAGAATVLALRSGPGMTPANSVAAPITAPIAALPATREAIPARAATAAQAPMAPVAPNTQAISDVRDSNVPAPAVRRRAPTRAILVAAAEKPAPSAIQDAPPPQWGLEAEGELLQKGRTAMVRGDSEGALAAVEEHAARFPQGRLAEEREALRIQVLVAEDRNPEARASLGAFQRAYPRSLLGPALEEAVMGRFKDSSGK